MFTFFFAAIVALVMGQWWLAGLFAAVSAYLVVRTYLRDLRHFNEALKHKKATDQAVRGALRRDRSGGN